ncbi:MAG: redoxin domain-containing protein [Deinococcus-Thermus bacterium]|nr:redoxin domain-containing protein [Deinococcota bacterium]
MSKRAERRRDERGEPAQPRARGRRATIAAAVGVVAVLAVVAVVMQRDGDAPATAGFEAPNVEMVAYQGEEVLGGERSRLHDVLGQGRPVVVNFWAASCPPCREEMPGFQRVYDELGDDYVMLGIDIGPFVRLGTHDGARAFLGEYDIGYPAAYAADENVVRDFEIRSMPTTVFFDADGAIVDRHTGFLPEDRLRRQIESLLTEGG